MNSPWNAKFYKEGKGSENPIFRVPHKDLSIFVRLLKEQDGHCVLDLGCGTGRHTVALAREGFVLCGLDISEKAVRQTQQWLAEEGFSEDIRIGEMYQLLPYKDNFFDGVISIKAMHHALLADIKRLVREIERVMKPKGILMIEVPKKNPDRYPGPHKEVEPGTLVFTKGPEEGVPHHIFCSEEELKNLSINNSKKP